MNWLGHLVSDMSGSSSSKGRGMGIERIVDESKKLKKAIEEIQTFGLDYTNMSEEQQFTLGVYVNLMNSSTQLLVNPIIGLQPKYTDDDFERFISWNGKKADSHICKAHRILMESLANLLYKIDLDDRGEKLLWKSFRDNKELRNSVHITKKEVSFDIIDAVVEALNYKYATD
jgi:hypothetical protein